MQFKFSWSLPKGWSLHRSTIMFWTWNVYGKSLMVWKSSDSLSGIIFLTLMQLVQLTHYLSFFSDKIKNENDHPYKYSYLVVIKTTIWKSSRHAGITHLAVSRVHISPCAAASDSALILILSLMPLINENYTEGNFLLLTALLTSQ